MCLAFCTLYVERGATPALHLKGGGEGGGRGGGGGRGASTQICIYIYIYSIAVSILFSIPYNWTIEACHSLMVHRA